MQTVRKVTTNPIELQVEVDKGNDAAISKDNQSIAASLTAFYRYDNAKLVEMYRQYGEKRLESAILISVKESFKDVIGGYDIFSIAQGQEEIRSKVRERLEKKMSQYPVMLVDFKISNYTWSDAFNAQIEATMQKAQQVKQAEQDLKLSEQQAQKVVKTAEAEKAALVTKAEGMKAAAALNAEAKALEGEGIKKYNDAIATNLEVQLKLKQLDIEMKKAEAWNGAFVPNNVYYPIPFNTIGGIKQ